GPHAICATCHSGPDDKGAVAANAMRSGIDRLKIAIDQSAAAVSRVKNAGIEVGPQELALADARSHLTLARAEAPAFEPPRVEGVIAEGLKITDRVEAAANQGVAELRYRRLGLALSLGAILLFVVALGLKIRQLERRG